jgi:predicted neutral ceramidase superfamily lipid hydrolase
MGGIMMILCIVMGIVGWLWMVALAFNNEEMGWAVACLIFFPACVLYGINNMDEAKIPLILIALGIVGRISVSYLMASA